MAKFVGKNLRVKIGSTELTTNIASVEVTETVDEIETTAFGQAARSRIAGLKDASVTISFHQDYEARPAWSSLQAPRPRRAPPLRPPRSTRFPCSARSRHQ